MKEQAKAAEQRAVAEAYTKIITLLHAKWKPHPAQIAIGAPLLRGETKDVMAVCGRNFGKTELMVYLLWRWALSHPGSENYYFAPFAKQAREILWAGRRLQDFVDMKSLGCDEPGDQQMRITLRNGSFIKLDGSDNVEAYRGVKPKGLSIFDEFKDFRPEFYEAYDPNRAAHESPLLIIGTPPDREGQFIDLWNSYKKDPSKRLYEFPSSANPHISKRWLEAKKKELYDRGEADVWEREYEAKFVKGGKKKIFPMLDKTKHVMEHDKLMQLLRRDRKKLLWYAWADPAAATCFAILYTAINPYTRHVYCLDEVYELDQAKMSVKQIGLRSREQREDLWDDLFAWRCGYDEAETWFRNEMLDHFNEGWEPSHKHANDKESGLSLIKDLLLSSKFTMSSRCEKLFWEMDNYYKDDRGQIPKKDDHLIDTLRYTLAADHYTVNQEDEKVPEEEESWRSDKLNTDLMFGRIEGRFGG